MNATPSSTLSRFVVAAAAVCLLAPQALVSAEDVKPGQTSTERDYVIGAGDKLRIEVYKDPAAVAVASGAAGRQDYDAARSATSRRPVSTPIALRDVIAKRLKEFVTNPVVTVIVVEASAATAYVVGEVNSPGAVTLQGGQLTVLQALALAGGLKDFADSKNIRILRKSITGTQAIDFNYKEAIRGVGQPVYLRSGDTVVVPD